MLDVLLGAGADVDWRDADDAEGRTALVKAAMLRGDDGERAVRLLLERGADANVAAAGTGRTPAIEAARWGNDAALEALIDAGADVNATDADGNTAAVWAAQCGETLTFSRLVDAGASLAECPDGLTAGGWAATRGDLVNLRCALRAGGPVSEEDDGLTEAMRTACCDGDLGALRTWMGCDATSLPELEGGEDDDEELRMLCWRAIRGSY